MRPSTRFTAGLRPNFWIPGSFQDLAVQGCSCRRCLPRRTWYSYIIQQKSMCSVASTFRRSNSSIQPSLFLLLLIFNSGSKLKRVHGGDRMIRYGSSALIFFQAARLCSGFVKSQPFARSNDYPSVSPSLSATPLTLSGE